MYACTSENEEIFIPEYYFPSKFAPSDQNPNYHTQKYMGNKKSYAIKTRR